MSNRSGQVAMEPNEKRFAMAGHRITNIQKLDKDE